MRKAKPLLGELKDAKSKSRKKRGEIQNTVVLPKLEKSADSDGVECNQCGRLYSSRGYLQRHKNTTCKEKPTRTPFGYVIPVFGKSKQLNKTAPN